MTDINRLIASLKRRSAHVKEFGDDITFVKLEDLDALVEVVELARTKAAEWEEKAAINYAEHTAMIQHIGELESSSIADGILSCSKCSFVQTKNIISIAADTIVIGNSKPEPCPNGCGPLQPVTWKALAIQLMFTTKQGVSDLLEAKKRISELESRTVTVKLPPLNDDLISILGRPNFMCAHLAELLRKSGEDIKRKSEHEQAAVIHWFLSLYLEHGDKWEGVAKSDMQARAAGIKLDAE
ncbi:hypothetical protein [Klebsiella pneumoniae]|uniref:hypothetical protein n=1 Tax=Klebsiella pneumoniae TaxID=573 RepID=UPI0018A76832|nr:hypothetical protein [Klebsiella pneumoniae]MBF8421002.1 hypothetical protein [Klebsiella pneumoniae]